MSLYLKYRPQDFDNLVWQDFINNTLKKAISEKKTVWAYLFCWPRWTWKTSTARLFAKTVNCMSQKDWNPCLKCDICKDFLEEKLVDIIEIDAASHTWVDNIREIIEKANFTPTKTTYKIYIIDEVHMLSKWAFNALLKILEEPPEHVKFILATTETHKVPETIISRCQRYDFRKISWDIIKSRLSYIAKEENITIDDESLEYIQKNSLWGLRNAISLFEQLNDWGNIEFKAIIEKLWIVKFDKISIFLDKLINKDNSLLDDYEKIIEDWYNLRLFFKELIFFTKDKIISDLKKWENITSILDVLELLDNSYYKTKQSLDESTTFLIWILKILNWGSNSYQPSFKSKKEEININASPLSDTKLAPAKARVSLKIKGRDDNEITKDDIWDIFWEDKEEININPSPLRGTSLKSKGRDDSLSFDKELFIKTLKENWAKSGLTMSIRWSDTTVFWEDLKIKFKTGFALNQVNSPDNLNLLNKSLDTLWFKYKIILS